MKLHSVRVKNYKCIDDSGRFAIGDLTCLAGKNEAGKTAILQALRRQNPVESSEKSFDPLMEYPRVRAHEASSKESRPEVLITEWLLSEDDIEFEAQVLGPEWHASEKVEITRKYNTDQGTWTLEINEPQVISNLVRKVGDLTPRARERVSMQPTVGELYHSISNNPKATQGEQTLCREIERFRDKSVKKAAIDQLVKRLPHFLYYSTYTTLPGRVALDAISSREHDEASQSEDDRLFLSLLNLAGTTIDELRDAGRSEELIAKLEAVSNRISRQIFTYWTQNRDLGVDFRFDAARPSDPPPFDSGYVFSLRVENKRHGVTVPFSERSAGFVWFFSFLVWFSQMEESFGDQLVILLDEPGLSLHGRAQADLLRYIKEQRLPKYQVLYTTHSPFMIDTSDILSVRTVEDVITADGESRGTKVSDRVLSADADTIFPLRAALGYDLTQSLFVGEHSLLVEGPSDLLFLRWATRQLEESRREGLDRRWTITPVGGITKISSFASLFGANQLNLAVLSDYHSGDKRKIRDLTESGILEQSQLFLATEFCGTGEADIEDMLGSSFYGEVINLCYGLTGKKRLTIPMNNAEDIRVAELAKEHLRTVVTEGPIFDHLAPAVYLVEHEAEFRNSVGRGKALDRFEEFFKRVNGLLPSG